MKTTDDLDEMFVVVDRDDNIVGYKTRRECHADPLLTHRAIAIMIRNSKGEILLQKRSMTKDLNPGKWTLAAGGHVTKDHTYKETAKRELKEELGIDIPLKFVTKFYNIRETESQMDAVYEGQYDGPFNINKDEVERVQFFTGEQIRKMGKDLTAGTKNVFEELKIARYS